MRYYRTTGLTVTQMQELVWRVNNALDKPWDKRIGRPKSLGLYKAVEAACMYLRQNAAQEFIGDCRHTSQPTISRYLAVLVPLVKSVLEDRVLDGLHQVIGFPDGNAVIGVGPGHGDRRGRRGGTQVLQRGQQRGTVIGQQISVTAATAIFARLTKRFGGRVPNADELAAVD